LWDHEPTRQSLIEESERLVYDQNEALTKAFFELYALHNYTLSRFMHYLGMLKDGKTAYSEIMQGRQEEVLGEDRLQTDRERMAAIAKAAEDKRKNR